MTRCQDLKLGRVGESDEFGEEHDHEAETANSWSIMLHVYPPGEKGALERTRGGKWVGANVMLDLILVDYDLGMVGVDRIIEAVKKAGYAAVPTATA